MQRASVIGRIFGRGAVEQLTPPPQRPTLSVNIEELIHKELVRPDTAQLAGEEALSFSHILIRDAAYRGLPKGDRAELHERFGTWLEESTGERAGEVEELIGYHLEQSVRYRRELGPLGDAGRDTMRRAGERLESAGQRALLRGDLAAAENLLGRAVALTAAGDPLRIDRQISLGGALLNRGGFDEAEKVFSEAIAAADEAGDERRRHLALISRAFGRVLTDPGGQAVEIPALVAEAMPVFEAAADELGLARIWQLRAEVERLQCRYQADAEALERALEHARRAQAQREIASIDSWLGTSICYGPMPVPDSIERCRAMLERAQGVRWFESAAHAMLAFLEALRGNTDEARELYATRRAHLEELGMTLQLAATTNVPAMIELLAGQPEEAERELRWGYDRLGEVGETEARSTIAARLARVLFELGRDDEAEELSRVSEELAAEDDVTSQVLWRAARAKVLARRDRDPAAEALAREAVDRALATDGFDIRGDAWLDLAASLRSLGNDAAAASAAQNAVAVYEAKGAAAYVALAQALALARA
jgi:tetratricopeptide (TPR) repeat protein